MRANKILVAVTAVIAISSTPVSSLDVPRNFARHDIPVCAALDSGVISLIAARGGFGIALISPHRCRD